jgi:hypothetical protein
LVTALIVIAIAAVAVGLAWRFNGLPADAPTTPQFAAPQQLDRSDFDHPEQDWLLVLFSSETCLSCHEAREVLTPIRFERVAVQDLPVETSRAIHDRYSVDAVPIMVLADTDGVVRWSYLGAPPAEALRDILVDIDVLRPDDGTSIAFP